LIVDFYVRGTPVSLQARGPSLPAWKAKVRATCPVPSSAPTTADVSVVITYFYDGTAPAVDIDNIIKPIFDAMKGVAYVDDNQVVAVHCSRVNTSAALLFANPTAALLAALAAPGDFVHVVVDNA
jgi:hypothetical protein